MSLFLPHRGWLLKLAKGCTPDDPPLGKAWAKHVLNLLARPIPEVLIAHTPRARALRLEPLVLSIKEVWFFGSEGPVTLPERPSGREEVRGQQRTLIYTAQSKALADLARAYEPVGLLLELGKSGGTTVRKLAREVLDGKLASLQQLAATLERGNHPHAPAVRQLSGGEPSPVPDAAVELADAQRQASSAPCPGCQSLHTRSVHRVGKEGPNHGRLFIKCRHCNRFEWASSTSGPDDELDDAQAQAALCPNCGKPRRALRVRKEGRNHGRIFLGCSDRACDSFEWLTPAGGHDEAPLPEGRFPTSVSPCTAPRTRRG
jgi:ssDNA-binding Zn-finger/Zn-ribbon topoisomerase 1